MDIKLKGIRCLYTVYPQAPIGVAESSYMQQISLDKRGYHALIIAPTYVDKAGVEQEFDVNYFDPQTRKPKPIDFSNPDILTRSLSF